MGLAKAFRKVGDFTFENRILVLIGSVGLSVFCMVGLFNLRMETDPQNLWVSEESVGYRQEMNFNDQYGAFFRTQQIILAQNDGKEANIFDHDHLYSFYFLLSLINRKKAMHEGRQIGIEDLCYKPISKKGCYRPSPLDLWKMNITDLAVDPDLQYTSLCIESRSENSRIPCSDENEIPIIKETIFGGITCNQQKDRNTSKIIPC